MKSLGHPRTYFRSSVLTRSLLLLAGISILGACASAPRFTPSRDLESAPSLEEGLLLCDEYRLPVPADRPIVMKPFVDCVDQLARRFPNVAEPSPFGVFHAELLAQYRILRDAYWDQSLGADLEVAVHSVLRALWQGAPSGKAPGHTSNERALVLRHFPQTAQALDARSWPVARDSAVPLLDPRLESVKAGLTALLNGSQGARSQAQGASPESLQDQARLCARLKDLRSEIKYLSELWRDQEDLAQLQQPSPQSIRDRYARGLEVASKGLRDLRGELRSEVPTPACQREDS